MELSSGIHVSGLFKRRSITRALRGERSELRSPLKLWEILSPPRVSNKSSEISYCGEEASLNG